MTDNVKSYLVFFQQLRLLTASSNGTDAINSKTALVFVGLVTFLFVINSFKLTCGGFLLTRKKSLNVDFRRPKFNLLKQIESSQRIS